MKKISISSQIIYGLLLGTILGALTKCFPAEWQPGLNAFNEQIKPLGSLFNRIIFMVVIPIVFCSLVSGIAKLGGNKIGRIGISYYKLSVIMIMAGIMIAFALSGIFKPGENTKQPIANHVEIASQEKKPVLQTIVEFVPSNPLEAMVNFNRGGLIPVMVFAVFIGFALINRPAENILLKLNEEILLASTQIVNFAMRIAPFSVGILMFTIVVTTGFEMMISLLGYVGALSAALLIQQIIVFSAILLIAGKSPIRFFGNIREVIATAFATTSSAVTTPVAMRVAEEKLRLEPEISRLILTLGVTGNKSATTIFLIVSVSFLAQLGGVHITAEQYMMLGFTAFISGIVTAGIPSAAIPVIAGMVAMIGAPAESIGLIVAADRIMDMLRTVVNVTGNLVIAEIVAGKKSQARNDI